MWCLDDHYVKFIGIVRAWRKDLILDLFFRVQNCHLLHLHYTRGELKISSPKLSSKLYCRSSKNSVTTADTRASFLVEIVDADGSSTSMTETRTF